MLRCLHNTYNGGEVSYQGIETRPFSVSFQTAFHHCSAENWDLMGPGLNLLNSLKEVAGKRPILLLLWYLIWGQFFSHNVRHFSKCSLSCLSLFLPFPGGTTRYDNWWLLVLHSGITPAVIRKPDRILRTEPGLVACRTSPSLLYYHSRTVSFPSGISSNLHPSWSIDLISPVSKFSYLGNRSVASCSVTPSLGSMILGGTLRAASNILSTWG